MWSFRPSNSKSGTGCTHSGRQNGNMMYYLLFYGPYDHSDDLNGYTRSTFAVRWSKWSHTITALSNITYKCSWIILNEFFEDFQPIETILKFYCIQNLEIFMKISPPHPNTTTNKIILWSKTFHSFSGMSLNMSGISWFFYESLGVLGDWEIGFEVKKLCFYDIH